MPTENMRRLLALSAMVTSTFVSSSIDEAPYRSLRWKDDASKKATKDRSKIKAARKQNRSRK